MTWEWKSSNNYELIYITSLISSTHHTQTENYQFVMVVWDYKGPHQSGFGHKKAISQRPWERKGYEYLNSHKGKTERIWQHVTVSLEHYHKTQTSWQPRGKWHHEQSLIMALLATCTRGRGVQQHKDNCYTQNEKAGQKIEGLGKGTGYALCINITDWKPQCHFCNRLQPWSMKYSRILPFLKKNPVRVFTWIPEKET